MQERPRSFSQSGGGARKSLVPLYPSRTDQSTRSPIQNSAQPPSHLPTRLVVEPPPAHTRPVGAGETSVPIRPVPVHDFAKPRSDSPHVLIDTSTSLARSKRSGSITRPPPLATNVSNWSRVVPSSRHLDLDDRSSLSGESDSDSRHRFTLGDDTYTYNNFTSTLARGFTTSGGNKEKKYKDGRAKTPMPPASSRSRVSEKPYGKWIAWGLIVIVIAIAVGVCVGLTVRSARSSNDVIDVTSPSSLTPSSSGVSGLTTDLPNVDGLTSESSTFLPISTKDPASATGLLTVGAETSSTTSTRSRSTSTSNSTGRASKSTNSSSVRRRRNERRLR